LIYTAKISNFFHSVFANGNFFRLILYLIRTTFAVLLLILKIEVQNTKLSKENPGISKEYSFDSFTGLKTARHRIGAILKVKHRTLKMYNFLNNFATI